MLTGCTSFQHDEAYCDSVWREVDKPLLTTELSEAYAMLREAKHQSHTVGNYSVKVSVTPWFCWLYLSHVAACTSDQSPQIAVNLSLDMHEWKELFTGYLVVRAEVSLRDTTDVWSHCRLPSTPGGFLSVVDASGRELPFENASGNSLEVLSPLNPSYALAVRVFACSPGHLRIATKALGRLPPQEFTFLIHDLDSSAVDGPAGVFQSAAERLAERQHMRAR